VVSVSQPVPDAKLGRATAGRRSREVARRGRRVEFTLTDGEFADLDTAAQLAGLSRGAYAAQAALAVARGGGDRAGVPLREALVELMTAAGAGAAGGHESQSSSGPVKCHGTARRRSAPGGTILHAGDPPSR
jgi:hypothetical protein